MFIIPLLQVMFILIAIVSGGIYFQEFDMFTPYQFIGFISGVLLICFGLYFLSPPKDKSMSSNGDEEYDDDYLPSASGYIPPPMEDPFAPRKGSGNGVEMPDDIGGSVHSMASEATTVNPGYFSDGNYLTSPVSSMTAFVGGSVGAVVDIVAAVGEVVVDDLQDLAAGPSDAADMAVTTLGGLARGDAGSATAGWVVTRGSRKEVDWEATTAQLNLVAAAQHPAGTTSRREGDPRNPLLPPPGGTSPRDRQNAGRAKSPSHRRP